MNSGVVKFFNSQKDYGFIVRQDGSQIFFAGSDLMGEGVRAPRQGETVTFEERRGPRGMTAVNVCNRHDEASVAAFNAWNTTARQKAREDDAATRERLLAYFKR